MRSPARSSLIRRSLSRRVLVVATSGALLLGVLGAAGPLPAGAAGRPATDTRVAGIDVDASTIPQLQALMNAHRLSSVQLVQFYLHRIRALQPRLHAVITVNRGALAEARRADALRRAGDRRPLLGIPILVKDNVNTTGMPTTAGSWALAGSTPGDAFLIQRLKAAGALIIGKANLSEWANFRSGPSSSGWTGIGGQTNMPYVLDRNPCGSSSGSGVAAAADLAVAAVGTETDGSIVCPSGANGVVGIKPTLGLWSRAGVVPISAEQDTAGPIARNVTDAAVLLGAATGVDPDDAATAAQAGHAFTDYTQFLDADALAGKRIGVWRETTYNDLTAPVVEPILADVIDTLEAQGATVVDHTDIDMTAAFTNEFPALLCEFKSDIATYLGTYTGAAYPKTLADLIAFDQAHPDLEGPWNDAVFEAAEATNGRDADCTALREATTPPTQAAVDDVMAANDLDAIIAITNGPAWPTSDDPELGDLNGHFELFAGSSTAAAVAGYGSVTVPAAYDAGLPIGISFIGGRWSEPELIADAFAFEQATHVRVKPTYIPTIGDALFPGVPNPASTLRAIQRSPAERGPAAGHQRRDVVLRMR
jgi:amidase